MFRALLANPLVPGATAAAGLRDALIEANLPYLPRFAVTGHWALLIRYALGTEERSREQPA
jgi:hypothetical protein